MKNFTLGFISASFFIQSILISKQPNDINYSFIPAQQVFMRVNNIQTVFRTDGIFNHDKVTFAVPHAGFIWPVPTGNTLSYASGLWIAAKVGPQRELRAAGCIYNSHYSPGNIPVIGQVPPASVCSDNSFKGYLVNLTDQSLINGGVRTRITGGVTYTFTYDAWTNWPVSKGAPYVDVNNIPGYQPGWNSDRPGIWHTTARPDEIAFMVYMDYTNCTNNVHIAELCLPGGTLPLGVEIQQISYAFLQPGLTDAYFINWKIINKSSQQWDSTYMNILDYSEINYPNDFSVCDSAFQLGVTYNKEEYYPEMTTLIGYRLLECPIDYTGNNSDTARLPYGNYPAYRLLKMTGFNIFINGGNVCLSDPSEASIAYNFMRGKNGCGYTLYNPYTGAPTTFKYNYLHCPGGWIDTIARITRKVITTGPLKMNPGEERFLKAVILCDKGDEINVFCRLFENTSRIAEFYNQNLGGDPIGITPPSTEVPEKFVLFQNYPNPFNPSTKIKFSISSVGNGRDHSVRIIIYDVLGREITTLVNEQLSAGTYEVDWDGTNYSSGVYYYKLVTDNFTESKKMLLIK